MATATSPNTKAVVLSTAATSGITCHAWNADFSKLALCPNNNELHIYGKDASGAWQCEAQLGEHDMLISAVDWCHSTNSIVTCSHDRNAFVWSQIEEYGKVAWKPSLVILRIDRSALDVKWSPNGRKFAAASGAKCVSVCSFEASEDWWVSKMIKKHRSSVVSLAWHPNSQFLATGATDFKCRVFSAYISDETGQPDPPEQSAFLGQTLAFGEPYAEFPQQGPACGWVTAVAWSPSGESLAFAAQDSSIHVVNFTSGAPIECSLRLDDLPLNALCFCSETGLIAGGHGFSPLAFTNGGNPSNWSKTGYLEIKSNAKAASAAPTSAAAQARAKFAAMTNKGTSTSETKSASDNSWKKHQSAISCMRPFGASYTAPTFPAVSTTGMDGRLVIWDLLDGPIPANQLGL